MEPLTDPPAGPMTDEPYESDELIAVVGLAGRFPESPDLVAFWDNLRQGRDCLRTFTEDDLEALGIPPEIYRRDSFVPRGTVLPERDGFDARFFGYTPNQASVMDPQARIFLETCYEALEAAGYDPFDVGQPVGVFAGSNPNDYALLLGVADPTDSLTAFDQLIGVDRDFLATRVSHNLGLTGPAMTIQTACSTSLVTVHAAAQSLLAYECSMALAGGVSINLRQGIGYFYQPGMILSPTGECRAFDANAQGTTLGQGCGVAVLKRLADAEADGDPVIAVVRATAINNDGRNKISYTAPSEDGQATVITTALELAGVPSDTIGYVETHGTGTLLGDPIEVAALTRAFRPGTDRTQFCAIGSAKTNFGHTDAAAGITGFIKAVLAVSHGEIPPSINFDEPNPEIDFANSPFYVNTELRPWPEAPHPRRAGVSAFGIGGTNAHAIIEEPPARTRQDGPTVDGRRVLIASGKTTTAADHRLEDLAAHLDRAHASGTAPSLAQVDTTLRQGRPNFEHRRAVVVDSDRSLSATLAGQTDASAVRGRAGEAGAMVWMFTGQGAQFAGMGAELYARQPAFAEAIDRVAAHLTGRLGYDLRHRLFPADPSGEAAAEELRQTSVTQPVLFAVEHALACLLRSWGLRPAMVVGHSIGEYAAAVEAGVLRWDAAAELVAERGRLMQAMAPGLMLATALPAAELIARLPEGVELAADNSSTLSVASGPRAAIEHLAASLEHERISATVLHTSHAFHSAMMDDAAAAFAQSFAGKELRRPTVPMMSNVTGQLLADADAVDPRFWASQIRRPVLFADCIASAAEAGGGMFIELGPGRGLCSFVNAHEALASDGVTAVPTMRRPGQERDDDVVLLEAIGRLWTAGVDIDWDLVNGEATASRVSLPPYRFDRVEAWRPTHRHVLALPHFGPPSDDARPVARRQPIDDWLYVPSWHRLPGADRVDVDGVTIVLVTAGPAGDAFIDALGGERTVVAVRPGARYERSSDGFVIDPTDDEQLTAVFEALDEDDQPVTTVIHAWLADPSEDDDDLEDLTHSLDLGVHSVLACARSLRRFVRNSPVQFDIVTATAFAVMGREHVRPSAAALAGPARIVPLEYTGVMTRLIDLDQGLASSQDRSALLVELASAPSGSGDTTVALRDGARWGPTVAPRPTSEQGGRSPLRSGGRYLIIGGLGGVGLSLARHLGQEYGASLVLTSRGGRPERTDGDPETDRRLALLDEIAEHARDLEIAAVDATDETAMSTLLDRLCADGQRLDGVIVAAGVADHAGAIHRRSRDKMNASIASKVHATAVLERVLDGRAPDFVLLSSSIAATLYHNRFAQVGYVTGNTFVEAFAQRARARGQRWTTVAWDDWLEIGMSVRAAQDFESNFGRGVDLVDRLNSFTPEDGIALFERALRADEPTILVSPTDLAQRMRDDVDVTSPFLEQAMADDTTEIEVASGASMLDIVSAAWRSLLGFDSFDPNDDFFELGGDSLQAARMADRLSRTLDRPIPVDTVLENPVLAKLVSLLEAEPPPSDGPAIAEPERFGPLPLGPAQRRFLDRRTEHPEHFNVSVLLRPVRPIAVDHLQAALDRLTARHGLLRVAIDPTADPDRAQVVAPNRGPAPLTVVDLRRPEREEARRQVELMSESVQRELNLSTGKVMAAVLFELAEGDQRLLFTLHHLVSDRISLLLIIDNLNADLRALADGQELPPPAPETAYLRWVEAQAAIAGTAQTVGRWADRPWDRVGPIPANPLATDDDNRNDSTTAVSIDVKSPELAEAATTLDECVLLALADAVATWSASDVALIDVLSHGRRLPLDVDVGRAVGMFITYGPVLVDQRADGSERLRSLRADLEDGWTFDALRFFGPPDIRARIDDLPRAQILFNFVGRAIAAETDAVLVAVDDEPKGSESDPRGRRDHLLAVRADVVDADRLRLVFVYSARHHDRATIERLAEETRRRLVEPSPAQRP